jgi:hypothetical protein
MNISERNDAFRKAIPFSDNPKNKVFLTRGIYAEFSDSEVADIITAVRNLSEFTPDNDPYKEHDFGAIAFVGRKLFWKIDDYMGQDNTDLVLTIMLAEDY